VALFNGGECKDKGNHLFLRNLALSQWLSQVMLPGMTDQVSIIMQKPAVDDYCRLRASCRWPVPSLEHCRAALENCLFGFVAVDAVSGKVIGMVRVVGDGILINYIQDLVVIPEWQGKGIGRRLMAAAMGELQQRAMPGSDVALISAPRTEGFYAKFGFACFKPEIPGMRRKL
jgi:GNAT superfamily N-acetyltransferase